MKKLGIIMIAALLTFAGTLSAAERKILKSETFSLEAAGGELTVNKFLANDEVGIEILDKSGAKLLDLNAMGSQDKLFTAMDAAVNLKIVDLTGDGVPEVVASAFFGPGSALYVFKFDAAGKKFAPVKFADNPDPEMHREYMVSDLPSEDGKDMLIKEDLSLVARGKIYPASPEDSMKEGEYLFKFADGAFKLVEKKELAVEVAPE